MIPNETRTAVHNAGRAVSLALGEFIILAFAF